MKKYCLVAVVILLMAILSACMEAYVLFETPGLIIVAGETEITTFREEMESFDEILKEDQNLEIPYIPLNQEFSIIIDDYRDIHAPDTTELKNYIINNDGSMKYTEKEIQTVPVVWKDDTATFSLVEHPAVFLSSDSADYKPAAVIRGFVLRCTWNGDEGVYRFIIRTDAG